jgi:hypothetical protein
MMNSPANEESRTSEDLLRYLSAINCLENHFLGKYIDTECQECACSKGNSPGEKHVSFADNVERIHSFDENGELRR